MTTTALIALLIVPLFGWAAVLLLRRLQQRRYTNLQRPRIMPADVNVNEETL